MCLYPKLIRNAKYIANKKNGGNIPQVKDGRVLAVPVGCGNCIECRKKKKREWQVRLMEEVKNRDDGVFVTLTFSNKSYETLNRRINKNITGYDRDNAIATLAVRRFLERWRKKHKKSVRHWLITELGHNGTENIHLHGFLFTDKHEEIEEIWKYGYIWEGASRGKKVKGKAVSYMLKYIAKTDLKHKYYKPIILTSKGIGKNYINSINAKESKYGRKTRDYYKLESGAKIGLPIYYRNKIYSDEEREKLWIEKLDENTRYVLGKKTRDWTEYIKSRDSARELNERLGYRGMDNYNEKKYEHDRRVMIQGKRLKEEYKEEVKIKPITPKEAF